MNRETYLARFRTQPEFLAKHQAGLKKSRELLGELERKVAVIEEVSEIISYLQRGEPEIDPGKYRPAYFFAESIDGDNVKKSRSGEPILNYTDPKTGEEAPIIIEYYQIYDSPDGDTWQARAIVILEGGTRIKEISKHTSSHRFL